MNESKRLLKPIIEMAINAGLLKRPPEKVHDVDFSLLLDVADARLAADEITDIEDVIDVLLMGLDVDPSDPVALRAYLIGFKGGVNARDKVGLRLDEYHGGLCIDDGVGMCCTYEKDGGASMNPEEKAVRDLKVMMEAIGK